MSQGLSDLDRYLSLLDRRIVELDLRWSRKVSRGMAGLLLLVSHLRQIGREMRATLMSSLSNLDRCLSSLDRRIVELDLRWSRKVSRGMAGLLLLVSHLRQIGREMRATLMSSLSNLDRCLSSLDRRIVELDLRWSRKVSRGMAGLLLLVSHLRQIGREMRATLMSSLSNLDRCLSSLDRRIVEFDLRWSRKVSRGMVGLDFSSADVSKLRLSILDRYLTRELLRAAFAVTIVLLLLIASKLFMQQLGYLMEGKFSTGIVYELLANKLLTYFVHMLPFLMLLSSVLALGRMHRDAEMTALHSCGYSDARLLLPMSMVGIPLALALGVMSLYVTPRLSLEAELAHHQARLEAGLDVMQEGRFMQTRNGRWALYASRTDGQVAEDVFFASYETESQQVHIETAARATRTLDKEEGVYVLDFEDGRWHSGWPGDADFQTMKFDRHLLRVNMAPPPGVWTQTKYMMPGQLWEDGSAAARAELQWRWSLPISLLLMLALAIPLSRSSVREGKYARAAYAIAIYLVYAQFQLLATSQVRGGNWPAWAGVWWVHVLMALGVVLLYHRARRSRA